MVEDPRCPECGEPIGQTATYCMHCSADLSGSGAVEATEKSSSSGGSPTPTDIEETGGRLLDPEGLLDDSLTVAVGILGGFVIGLVATVALMFITASVLALVGVVVWLLSTAYLVRRRTVQEAISRTAYGLALVLVLVPVIPLSPAVETNIAGRAIGFFVLVFVVGIPAGILAGIGYAVSGYVPDDEDTS